MDNNVLKFVEELRVSYRGMIPLAGECDPILKSYKINIPVESSDRKVAVRIYIPQQATNKTGLPIVIFAHGGCFVAGDLDTHDVMASAIANRAGAIVLYVDYRLAPEHPFKAGLDDMYTALVWASENAESFGGDSNRLVVCGDSAGANLSTVLTMLTRDRKGPKINAQWLIYPYGLTTEMNTESWKEFGEINFPTKHVNSTSFKAYYPENINKDYLPYVNPLDGNLQDLPPAFIQVGGYDPLKDDNIKYNTALIEAGVKSEIKIYANHQHGFIQFFKNKELHPEGEVAFNEGIQFLRSFF